MKRGCKWNTHTHTCEFESDFMSSMHWMWMDSSVVMCHCLFVCVCVRTVYMRFYLNLVDVVVLNAPNFHLSSILHCGFGAAAAAAANITKCMIMICTHTHTHNRYTYVAVWFPMRCIFVDLEVQLFAMVDVHIYVCVCVSFYKVACKATPELNRVYV